MPRLEPAPALDLSPLVPFTNWGELREMRDRARERGIEGLML
jgi:DNA ligase 1